MISLSWPQLLIELISVLLLFAFLRAKAFPPIVKAMRDRQERIRSDLETAEARRKEAEAMKAALEAEVRSVRERADQVLARAKKDAEDQARAILEEAQRESKRILAEAEVEIRRQREEVLSSLRAQIVEISLSVAEKILRERLDSQADRRLVDEFVERIEVPQ
ncbi:MAG: F0F1 ATP synthase subunit B [Firmicutes bacterium]|nr:F0F1 ATP synthase subunit B [Alicyclobacillaceae bacterium]MCL6497696.1 F0F1 ATP synthase subunit B [Bacillota bacterium]